MTTTQDPQRRPGELHCEGCSLHSSCMQGKRMKNRSTTGFAALYQ